MKRILIAILLLAYAVAYASSTRTGQVSVTTGTAVAVGSGATRVSLTIINTDGTNPIYCGTSSSVSSSTGLKIPAGYAYTWDGGPAQFYGNPVALQTMYCVATGSAVTAAYLENSSQ